ncbi:MAG: putative DNA binding domain-containing protein [Bacteroidaceae bacterium]|nr:putative DNA binding domain-containing protein [Bacteroidaceae bacterium]
MNAETLQNMVRCGETSTVQFKYLYSDDTKIARELVAFANSKGGDIIFGIDDKTGEMKGLTYEQVQNISSALGNVANEFVRPIVYLQTEVVSEGDKNFLVVHVDEGINKPYKDISGNIYVKQGPDKRRITENTEILRLFSDSNAYHPDESSVSKTSLYDLDDKLIDAYLLKVYGRGRNDFEVTYEKLMQDLKICDEYGRLTLAGLLYFGKNPQQFKPAFNIKAVAFYGNDMAGMEYRDSKDLQGTIPSLFDQAMHFLDMNLHHIQAGQNFNSLGILEVSKVALEEILQNALIHREYIKQAPIRLLVFDNRVEIISPGCLPDGLTVEQVRLGNTAQRNTRIATFCARTMYYRGLGTGILRAIKEIPNIEFVNDVEGNLFVATVWRNKDVDTPSGQTSDKSDRTDAQSVPTDAQSNRTDAESDRTDAESDRTNTESDRTNTESVLTTEEKVYQQIKADPFISKSKIAEILSLSESGVKKNIAKLVNARRIERVGTYGGHYKILD